MVDIPALLVLVGENTQKKKEFIKKIKEKLFLSGLVDFNFDTLYARELTLMDFQEKLLTLTLKAKRRVILIIEAEQLKEQIKEFILKYIEKPYPHVLVILDFSQTKFGEFKKDIAIEDFLNRLRLKRQKVRFEEFGKEEIPPDVSKLAKAIEKKDTFNSLKILNELLKKLSLQKKSNDKPELIVLGGLRSYWQKRFYTKDYALKLTYLLNCDLEIKQNRIPEQFALEKLVLALCNLRKF